MNKSWRSVLAIIWIIISLAFIAFKGISPAWQEGPSDFHNYYVSSTLLIQGDSISNFYDNGWFHEKAVEAGIKDGAKFAPFPPATAFLYLPLIIFKPLQAKRVWVLCNLFFLVILVFQLRSLCSLSFLEIVLLLSIFCVPIASNIRLGQSYLLFAILLVTFLKAIKRNQLMLGGGVLGVATALKYFPFIYILFIVKKGRKKIFWSLVISIFIVSLLPIVIDGFASYQSFIMVFFNHLNGDLSGQGQFSYTFQSIDALLANLFIYDVNLNPNALFDFSALKVFFKILFTLIVIGLTVKAYRNGIEKCEDLTISICIVAASLLIPASASYHLLLLFPALLLVYGYLRRNNSFKSEGRIIMLLTFLTCNFLPHHIPTIDFSNTLNTIVHFPRLYGLIALYFYLLTLQKRHLQKYE